MVLAFTIITSCKKELLDQKNPNTLTAGDFWKTESDALKGINSAYHMFYQPGSWSRWIYFRLDLTSDEGFSNSPWIELADWTRFNYINYNFFEGNVIHFRDFYKAIFRCNQVLAYVPNIQFADTNRKDQVIAEAKFLRGLYYYYAAILWENVPIVLKPSNPDDLPEYATVEQVWAQVEKDFSEAAESLPATWDAKNVGRPTKGAALAFLAKAYMQEHKWQEAKNAMDFLVTGAGKSNYGLVANYRDNFTHLTENNIESVFEIQFSDVNKTDVGDIPNSSMANYRSQFFAPRSIGWSDGQARPWIINEFKKENTLTNQLDPRLRYTLFYPQLEADFGDKIYGRSWEWGANEAWFRKYQRDYYRNNEDNFSQVNYRLIRYADVLLMYAECLNELGQTRQAYQHVNKVRERVNLRTMELAYPLIGNDKDLFRERLKMERALELYGESVRWADLKRWGLDTQQKVDVIKQRDPDFNNFVIDKHVRLPLPQTEIDNNPNLKGKQNPNY